MKNNKNKYGNKVDTTFRSKVDTTFRRKLNTSNECTGVEAKALVDRHRHQKEKLFAVEKPVLVFQTKLGLMPKKLRFRWTRPFWIVDSKNDTYQVGTLLREILPKWVNGF